MFLNIPKVKIYFEHVNNGMRDCKNVRFEALKMFNSLFNPGTGHTQWPLAINVEFNYIITKSNILNNQKMKTVMFQQTCTELSFLY